MILPYNRTIPFESIYLFKFSFITLNNWITIVGMIANNQIYPYSVIVNGATSNKLWSGGTNNTRFKRIIPHANAPRLAQLFLNPILKIECSLLQLNPWNKRAAVNTENAIVLASAAPPSANPI